MLTITVNATTTNGTSGFNTVDVPLALTVSKYNVVIPSQEGVGDNGGGSSFDGFGIAYSNNVTSPIYVNDSQFGSWDVNYLYANFRLNSTSQYVCVKNQFNVTRYGQSGSQAISYNVSGNTSAGTKIMLVDNSTPGVYDTVVFNLTTGANMGTIVVLSSSNRNLSPPDGTGGLYLWDIQNCGYFTMVNSSKTSIAPQGSFSQNYGGSHQRNTNFVIPYVVSLGSASSPTFQSGNTVGIKGVGQQNAGKNGGFGFTGKLTVGTDYTTTGATTDANGVAFVTLNVNASGNFMAFWNVTISGDTDAADFSSATPFDARAFNSYTNIINSSAVYNVVLFNNATGGEATFGTTSAIYNGTANTNSGILQVEYDTTATNQRFAMRFIGVPGGVGNTYANQSLNAGGTSYNVAWITTNVTNSTPAGNNRTITIYASSNTQTGVVSVVNATQNITVSICGQSFLGNPPSPITTMVVNNITTEDWSHGGTTKMLTMYEMMNNTNVTGSNVAAGPAGCVLLNVAPGQLGTWPSASGFTPPVFVNAFVTNGTDSQQIYVANVFRTG
ncbi:MAG: hypothetical protein HYS80_02440 [Candidatus Aenigmarchaeota archaeon]|nr:hypothetical protein [Candidatus Aenigmarchaeota archaeon]